MKGAAQFFLDTLVEEPTAQVAGDLPVALAREHVIPADASVCAGPTMDMEIIRDLFTNCIRAAEILAVDADFRAEAGRRARAARADTRSARRANSRSGWMTGICRPRRSITGTSRTCTACIPSGQITPRGTPDLAAAVPHVAGDPRRRWHRLGRGLADQPLGAAQDGDHAYSLLTLLMTPPRTLPNMFDSCPPFQIDGNFGGCCGHRRDAPAKPCRRDRTAPALPKAWPTGSVKGLRARGGFEVDIAWKDGRLVSATLRSTTGTRAKLRYGPREMPLELKAGESRTITRL